MYFKNNERTTAGVPGIRENESGKRGSNNFMYFEIFELFVSSYLCLTFCF